MRLEFGKLGGRVAGDQGVGGQGSGHVEACGPQSDFICYCERSGELLEGCIKGET